MKVAKNPIPYEKKTVNNFCSKKCAAKNNIPKLSEQTDMIEKRNKKISKALKENVAKMGSSKSKYKWTCNKS